MVSWQRGLASATMAVVTFLGGIFMIETAAPATGAENAQVVSASTNSDKAAARTVDPTVLDVDSMTQVDLAKSKSGTPAKTSQPPKKTKPETPPGLAALTFRVVSFNVLGSQHTTAWGDSPQYASGKTRAGWATRLMQARGYDIVGLQESQRDQVHQIVASGAWKSWPNVNSASSIDVAQSIAWRDSEWKLVKSTKIRVPFLGKQRAQPVVLLQHKKTQRMVWVINVHLAPKRYYRGEYERDVATAKLIRKIQHLRATSPYSVVVTGDMNEHSETFCKVTAQTALKAAAGGSNNPWCAPPSPAHIEWIFGSPNLQWSRYRYAEDAEVRRITDHGIPVVDVTIPAT